MPKGLLLINLGTPEAPKRAAVASYLKQFLTDPRVIELPAPFRHALVRGIIVPMRSERSARAYRRIWTSDGSPLLVHAHALATSAAQLLGEEWRVAVGMRYGSPSIETALKRLSDADCGHVVVLPLYPQYSSATTGSSLEALGKALGGLRNAPAISVVPPFYDASGFLEAIAAPLRSALARMPTADVLFSFHGLPERQVRGSYDSCLHEGCCQEAKPFCYRSQCLATAQALAHRLTLPHGSWHVSFQSRLGREPWLSPSTLETARSLAREGSGRLVLAAPSFVADCLETLEELGSSLRNEYLQAGGREFFLAPCPNASDTWASTVATWARNALPAMEVPSQP